MRGYMTRDMFACVPEIDFNSGYRYFLGNVRNYAQALLTTLKSIKAKLPILKTMSMTQEYDGLRSITQVLQKMFQNIGATELAESSYQLERLLLNDGLIKRSASLEEYMESLEAFAEHLELLFKALDFKNAGPLTETSATFLNYDFTKTRESIKLSSNLLERRII